MKKITAMLVAFVCLGMLLLSTCKKETTHGTSALAVRLKDAPAGWDRCMVELRGLRLHSERDGWITIPISDTVIDILKLQDTSLLLSTINLNAGTINQVDLMLGMRDSITIGDATFFVSTLAGDSDDVAINVSDTLIPGGSFTMVLDLNAAECVRDDGGGHFHWHGVIGHSFGRDRDDHHGH